MFKLFIFQMANFILFLAFFGQNKIISSEELSDHDLHDCVGLRWTDWINLGDPDHLAPAINSYADFVKVGKIAADYAKIDTCVVPVSSNCRILVTDYDDVQDDQPFLTCPYVKHANSTESGWAQMRFLCWDYTCQHFQWSKWYNVDSPSDGGDVETLDSTIQREQWPCLDGTGVLDVECFTALNTSTSTNRMLRCDLNGFECVNEFQDETCVCEDYMVRFLCLKPSRSLRKIPQFQHGTTERATLEFLDETTKETTTKLARTGETRTGETRTGETRTEETRTEETRTGETRTGETRTGETRTGETRTGETRTGETRTGETRTGETRTGETRTGETRTGETRTDQTRTGETRPEVTTTTEKSFNNKRDIPETKSMEKLIKRYDLESDDEFASFERHGQFPFVKDAFFPEVRHLDWVDNQIVDNDHYHDHVSATKKQKSNIEILKTEDGKELIIEAVASKAVDSNSKTASKRPPPSKTQFDTSGHRRPSESTLSRHRPQELPLDPYNYDVHYEDIHYDPNTGQLIRHEKSASRSHHQYNKNW